MKQNVRLLALGLGSGSGWSRPSVPIRLAVTALLITLGASALAGAPAPTTDAARAGGSTASTCNGLLHQFDVAWPTHQQMTRAARAKKSRDLGESQCRDGRTAEGVRSLRRALHDIGVKPVKIVSSAAR